MSRSYVVQSFKKKKSYRPVSTLYEYSVVKALDRAVAACVRVISTSLPLDLLLQNTGGFVVVERHVGLLNHKHKSIHCTFLEKGNAMILEVRVVQQVLWTVVVNLYIDYVCFDFLF